MSIGAASPDGASPQKAGRLDADLCTPNVWHGVGTGAWQMTADQPEARALPTTKCKPQPWEGALPAR